MYFRYVVYKVTFPNGKIYIGKDIGGKGHTISYFGSWDSELVSKDFTKESLTNFTIQKEIIFESEDKLEVTEIENELIRRYNSNNPNIGYNQTPKFHGKY